MQSPSSPRNRAKAPPARPTSGDNQITDFFDESVTNTVYAVSPYSSHGQPTTTNETDGIYTSSMNVTPSGTNSAGYTCALTIGVQTS